MLSAITGLMVQQTSHKREHIHLVGIGGSGMSAIAWVLLGRGYHVSGSDLQHNALTAELEAAGATIFTGHAAGNIAGADLLVISSAVPPSNPELAAAIAAGTPVLKRADFLGRLMADHVGIAIAGTHGKTTITGMVAQILLSAGRDPSFVIGGVLPSLRRNGRAGKGDTFVVEADEYDHMFLGLRPRLAVVTNIEHDHPDIFPTAADYQQAFSQFAALVPTGGAALVCSDDTAARELLAGLPDEVNRLSYGLSSQKPAGSEAHYWASELRPNQRGGLDFLAFGNDELLGLLRLRIPGEHNVRNALAALAVSRQLAVAFPQIQEALAAFGGIERRFQHVGQVGDVLVIDDYAHHPTEIRVNLAAARQQFPGRRLWAVWQPHTFSRTRLLLDEFASSFTDADRVIALDIYASRERDSLGVSTADVVTRMNHPYVRHIGRREEAAAFILDRVRPGDVILTLGAGDGNQVGEWVLAGLRNRSGTQPE